ncbi:TetR/AcrR family transcriptional regulator [Thermosipho ferrireducens]|uniref:TetR/AcrR family transcriptional regulator n=1 Tax=Thermosipho ferrireducens TaxID=2571116 RepID=A0ABX7S7C8_9BACT|nr:TetR/AcrR family transcriptional regulator [Thermosipho ferrireducens]QTA38114.1 TetR/AcrR family transcriptional regulator [Thermosipho ferrireducens]
MRKKSTKTRETILEAARVAFSQKGYDAVSMDEIAQIAGVRKSLIYYYFPSKEILFEEVWVTSIDSLEKELFSETENENIYSRKIKNFLKKYIDFITSKKAISELIRKEKTKVFDEENWQTAKMRYVQFLDKIETLIREGKKQAYIREEIDPKAATEMIASVDSMPRKSLLKTVEEMLLKVLLKDTS